MPDNYIGKHIAPDTPGTRSMERERFFALYFRERLYIPRRGRHS